MRAWLCRTLTILAILVVVHSSPRAAEIEGIQLPDRVQVDGRSLVLNGFGQRLYSFLRIPVFVAALYVQHLSTDGEAIIHSPDTKLLTIRFRHDVSADDIRDAWREGLENNCRAPCRLDPGEMAQFLAQIPTMHVGDVYAILFTSAGATVQAGGRAIGTIRVPHFAEAMLATFLGPQPTSDDLKRDLLQHRS